jgi:hypothetical protein
VHTAQSPRATQPQGTGRKRRRSPATKNLPTFLAFFGVMPCYVGRCFLPGSRQNDSKVRTTARNNQWEFHWETMRESCFTGFVVFKFQFLHSAFGCRAMHFRQHQSFKFTILGYRAQSPPSRGFFHAIERRESSRGAFSFTPSSVENRLEGLLGRCNRGRRWSMAPLDSSRLWRRARGFDLRRV